jgi:glycosyltransferase involved in cell wall biosynthesis
MLSDFELISVIIPVYNGEKCISGCLESVLAQTYTNFEIIIIDDGSTDATVEVCGRYATANPCIKIKQIANSGPGHARNCGIEAAIGQFIYFLDADDCIENDAFALLISQYNSSPADLIITGYKCFDGKGNFLRTEAHFGDKLYYDHQDILSYLENYLVKPNKTELFGAVWGRLFNADLIRKYQIRFNDSLRVFEDADFNFKYLKYTERVSCIKIYSYNYTYMVAYISASTKMSDYPEKIFDHLAAMQSLAELFQPEYPDKAPEQIVGHACISLTIIQLIRNCGQAGYEARRLVRRLVDHDMVRKCLPYYSPGKGESKLIPLLMRLKWVTLMIMVCRYKAHKRYGKCRK